MIEISNFLYNLVRGLASHLLSDPETRRNLLQGDWQSDAYLVYLELSQQQKQRAGQAMADKLLTMFPE